MLTTEAELKGKNMPNTQTSNAVTSTVRNRPPFPGLPSYNATALILAFTGYADEVKDLLKKLSHRTAIYFETHQPILKGVLLNWNSKIVEIVEFEDVYQSSSLKKTVSYKI